MRIKIVIIYNAEYTKSVKRLTKIIRGVTYNGQWIRN